MQPRSATIAIIGGGFSGTVLAANLLHRPPLSPTRIILIERRSHMGRGVAYSPGAYRYLLNVPASRMSATSYAPAQLLEFARRQIPEANGDSYLSRQLYGEYLQECLRSAEQAAPRHVQLERVHGEVTAMQTLQGPGPVIVHMADQQYVADQVVLACGDPSPAVKSYATQVAALAAYVRDPHQSKVVLPTDQTVLLIGTGLTMIDMSVAAASLNPAVRLIALSRHGVLPASQRSPPGAAVLDAKLDPCGLLSARSLRQMVAAVRALTQEVETRGGDWREAITRTRDYVPALWHNLSEVDRHRFLRHVRVYWDTHRHRMAPEFAERVAAMRRSGQLQVRAGCINELSGENGRIRVRWRPRGGVDLEEFSVDRVVDCTGSDHRLQRTRDVLWRQLIEAGLASPDPAGLGLRTGQYGALVDAAGRSAAQLFYLGPMLRAAHWEATAVGELRSRAEALAAALASRELVPAPAQTDAA
jgi:uncharacterized NAD(P)/FAD-binding protein YdhS